MLARDMGESRQRAEHPLVDRRYVYRDCSPWSLAGEVNVMVRVGDVDRAEAVFRYSGSPEVAAARPVPGVASGPVGVVRRAVI